MAIWTLTVSIVIRSPAVKAFALTDYNCNRNFCRNEPHLTLISDLITKSDKGIVKIQ